MKLLKKIRFLLARIKHKKNLKSLISELYKKKETISIKFINNELKERFHKNFYNTFRGTIKIENSKFYLIPAAILTAQKDKETYFKNTIKSKRKNKVRKAIKNNFSAESFNWNDYLDDIFEIHTSKLKRQNQDMSENYKKFPKKINSQTEKNFAGNNYFGIFKEKKLVAYVEFFNYGDIAVTNRIMGHGDFLRYGIMNFLFYELIDEMNKKNIKFLNYISIVDNSSLSKFKKDVGFQNKLVEVVK